MSRALKAEAVEMLHCDVEVVCLRFVGLTRVGICFPRDGDLVHSLLTLQISSFLVWNAVNRSH